MKQVIFVSGGEVFKTREDFKKWLAGPESDFMLPELGVESMTFWSRNLAEDLGDDYDVLSISMPLKQHAKYDEWKIWFEKHIQFMHDEVILVGWSLGANFFVKYLSEEILPKRIISLHLIAGCTNEFVTSDSISIPLDKIFVYHSRDDDIVLFDQAERIMNDNPSATLIEYQDKNHFLVEQIPELLENIRNS